MVLRVVYKAENERRDRLAASAVPAASRRDGGDNKMGGEGLTFLPGTETPYGRVDCTDKERLDFRYII